MAYDLKIPQKILNEDHYAMIVAALAAQQLAQQHLNQAKAVGFDTTKLQADFDAVMAKLLAIRREYFPGR